MESDTKSLRDMGWVHAGWVGLVVEGIGGRVPEFEKVAEASLLLFREVGHRHFDLNARCCIVRHILGLTFNRLSVTPLRCDLLTLGRCVRCCLGEVSTLIKVMFINWRCTVQSVWAQRQVERLE